MIKLASHPLVAALRAYIDFKKALEVRIESHVKIIIVSCVKASSQFSFCVASVFLYQFTLIFPWPNDIFHPRLGKRCRLFQLSSSLRLKFGAVAILTVIWSSYLNEWGKIHNFWLSAHQVYIKLLLFFIFMNMFKICHSDSLHGNSWTRNLYVFATITNKTE